MPDVSLPPIPCPWLPELAQGYLRRFDKVRPLRDRGLWGYTLETRRARGSFGFFVGFILPRKRRPRTQHPPELAECVVFAYVRPPRSALHKRLVRDATSPIRRAYELLTKYTNRWPRFEFHEKDWRALARHVPLAAFPAGEEEKYARNFFTETLALLLRSGLPGKLAGLPVGKKNQTPRSHSG